MNRLATLIGSLLLTCFSQAASNLVSDLARLKDIAKQWETTELRNPTNASTELGWLTGAWRCESFAFPVAPSGIDVYAWLTKLEIESDGIEFYHTSPHRADVYISCTFGTNVPGHVPPKDHNVSVFITGKDFWFVLGDVFFIKKPNTNNPAAFLLQHQISGNLMLFRRDDEPSKPVDDLTIPVRRPKSTPAKRRWRKRRHSCVLRSSSRQTT